MPEVQELSEQDQAVATDVARAATFLARRFTALMIDAVQVATGVGGNNMDPFVGFTVETPDDKLVCTLRAIEAPFRGIVYLRVTAATSAGVPWLTGARAEISRECMMHKFGIGLLPDTMLQQPSSGFVLAVNRRAFS